MARIHRPPPITNPGGVPRTRAHIKAARGQLTAKMAASSPPRTASNANFGHSKPRLRTVKITLGTPLRTPSAGASHGKLKGPAMETDARVPLLLRSAAYPRVPVKGNPMPTRSTCTVRGSAWVARVVRLRAGRSCLGTASILNAMYM